MMVYNNNKSQTDLHYAEIKSQVRSVVWTCKCNNAGETENTFQTFFFF